jgi:peptidoglycan/LPS O-acetylase OafA/YrhL
MSAFFRHKNEISSGPQVKKITLNVVLFFLFTLCAMMLWRFELAFSIIPVISGVSFVFLLNILRDGCCDGPMIRRIGKVSFSIYIFHFIFIKALTIAAAKLSGTPISPSVIFGVGFVFVCFFSFRVALITERLIEANGILAGNRVITWLHARSMPSKEVPAR